MRGLLVFAFLTTLTSAAVAQNHYVTPTRLAQPNEIPRLIDDLDFENMDLAIDRQLERFSEIKLSGTVQFGEDIYQKSVIEYGLRKFKRIYRDHLQCMKNKKRSPATCQESFSQSVTQHFNFYLPDLDENDPRHDSEEPTFFTGYYTIHMNASPVKTNRYKYAVYARPKEADLLDLTRVDIDFDQKLEGNGYELFYTDDLYDLYLLHVEGGGRAVFTDGRTQDFYLSYNGTNEKEFNFIVTYMKEKGMLKDDLSIEAQKAYLEKNPQVQREVYNTCPSYVFFYPSDEPPIGSDAVSLTDNRSIATDRFLYSQKGGLAFIQTERVDPNSPKDKPSFKKFSRFVLDQDTGGAIRGKARVDIYFGEDEYSKRASYIQSNYGKIFFLMPK